MNGDAEGGARDPDGEGIERGEEHRPDGWAAPSSAGSDQPSQERDASEEKPGARGDAGAHARDTRPSLRGPVELEELLDDQCVAGRGSSIAQRHEEVTLPGRTRARAIDRTSQRLASATFLRHPASASRSMPASSDGRRDGPRETASARETHASATTADSSASTRTGPLRTGLSSRPLRCDRETAAGARPA